MKRLSPIPCISILLFLCLSPASSAKAAGANSGQLLHEIEIEGVWPGAERVVLDELDLTTGTMASQDDLNAAAKRLYGSGLFDDVRIEWIQRNGYGKLGVWVQPRTTIHELRFVGNESIKEKELR